METQTDEQAQKERRQNANRLVRRFAGYTAAAGLVPVPIVDLAAVTGLQVKMLAGLSEIYEVPFSETAGRSYIAALIGGLVPISGLSLGAMSLVKGVPLLGTILTMTVVPGFAAASTWAVGRVFTLHFERGGTLLNLDLSKMKEDVKSEYGKAKEGLGRLGEKIRGGKSDKEAARPA
jgi:uncharacterized protein (DUF697 family)